MPLRIHDIPSHVFRLISPSSDLKALLLLVLAYSNFISNFVLFPAKRATAGQHDRTTALRSAALCDIEGKMKSTLKDFPT
jgi:hypothetical protein